jgi:hypothetical protein
MNRKSKEFIALQQKWYKKLSDEGFNDAEEVRGSELVLKQTAHHPLRWTAKGDNPTAREAKQRYYELLEHRVNGHTFIKPVHEQIMTLLSKGFTQKEICAVLRATGAKPSYRGLVKFIIRRYEDEWGLKKWTQKEMGKPPIK